MSQSDIRNITANFMRENPDEFKPFLYFDGDDIDGKYFYEINFIF